MVMVNQLCWDERAKNTQELVDASLEASSPQNAVRRHMIREGDWLRVGDCTYHLPDFKRVLIIGFGKAAAAMAQAAEGLLGNWLTGGLVVTHYGHALPLQDIEIVEAGHPLPDENGVVGAERMLEFVGQPLDSDLIIALISGGGSTLFTLPVPGVTLSDLQVVNELLLLSGADIHQFNAVRKHLSQVKGGRLAQRLYPAQVVSLLLSDVLGNDESVIASGPLAPDPSTFEEVWDILDEFRLSEELPGAVRGYLRRGARGEIADNPDRGDRVFERIESVIVGDNQLAAQAALARAEELGFAAQMLTPGLKGEAREAAQWVVAGAPVCLVGGGETIVRVRGDGKGGRNQELALAAAVEMAVGNDEKARLVTLATDGRDGPTDAAGAFAESDSVARAAGLGIDALQYLENNDSYSFFSVLGDLIVTGPTGTNVNDLVFWLSYSIE